MAKLFEAAGAGCCPVVDDMDELAPLGFVNGETAITFRSHVELVDRLRWWFDRPAQFRELGRAAARLAHARHTWAHRAIELRETLARRLASRTPEGKREL
jgi:glycosyltransferase involved in cell wall biosynthesis